MGNFKRNDRSGGRGGRDRRSQMHKAVCADCGKNCEVPFKPTGDKPIYCSSCFESKGGGGARKFDRKKSDRYSSGDRKMYDAVCDSCGKKCEVPFKPTGDKSVYCSACFGKGGKKTGMDQTSKQLEMINAKLDQILKVLNPASSAVAVKKSGKAGSGSAGKEVVKKKVVAKKNTVAKPKKATKSKAKKKSVSKKKTVKKK